MTEAPLPLTITGPQSEEGTLVFTHEGPWQLDELPSLFVGDLELGPQIDRATKRLYWRWSPDFYAGEALITLRRGRSSTCSLVSIDPQRSKLTREAYAQLVAALARQTRRLFTLSPTRTKTYRSRRGPLKLAQLDYLRAQILRIAQAVRAIARSPKKRLVDEALNCPLALADSATAEGLLALVRAGNLVRAESIPPRAARLVTRLHGFLPREVITHQKRITYDVPENRFVAFVLAQLDQLLRRASTELSAAAQRANTAGLHAQAYLTALRQVRRVVFDLQALPFLADVKVEEVDPHGLVTFRRHPHYKAVLDAFRDLLMGLDPVEGVPLGLSVDQTYRLYEVWATLEIVAALQAEFATNSLDLSALQRWVEEDVSFQVPRDRQVVVQLSEDLIVRVQKTFKRYGPGRAGTYSHEMRPDIVVERTGEPRPAAVVFDPKYRGESGLLEAMNDLHRYKDAIVTDDLHRVIVGAYAIAPGLGRLTEYGDPAWQARHQFGIIAAQPNETSWTTRVCEIVRELR